MRNQYSFIHNIKCVINMLLGKNTLYVGSEILSRVMTKQINEGVNSISDERDS